MIRLLISVKSAEEALDAMHAGADFIDLKDPAVGALGSLDDAVSLQAVRAVNQQAMVSATVGDAHESLEALLALILRKSDLGVDIVKLPASSLPMHADGCFALAELIQRHQLKLIAVMFAEQPIEWAWIPKLAKMGFYAGSPGTKFTLPKGIALLLNWEEGQIGKTCLPIFLSPQNAIYEGD